MNEAILVPADPGRDQSLNIRAILLEVQNGLKTLKDSGRQTIIDLGAIPLSSFERMKLFGLLGTGEVDIRLSSLGESEIYETLFSAVWVIKHLDEQGEVLAMFIEVNKVPDIVLSQSADIPIAQSKIKKLIENL